MGFRAQLPILLLLAAVTAAAAASAAGPSGAQGPLSDGVLLSSANADAARGLLPDDILAHYQRGEYANAIVDPDRPGRLGLAYPPEFQAASRANRGRYALGPTGSIIDAKTGAAPGFILGLPFPDIQLDDPQAGTKVVWNFFYGYWYRGDSHLLTDLTMLGRSGIERRITTDVFVRVYDAAPEVRDRPDPNGLFYQTLARVVAPADLNGIVSLSWRYRDGARRDASWTYVPGLRRAREVNPLNRSDGFLGSDISLDEGAFFDAKPEDFTFRLVGRQDQLVMVDPFSLRGEGEVVPLPGGGWRSVWKDVPRIGADDPAWRGLPWAPPSVGLARRPIYVVEARPRDPNYLYGRILLRFDAETFRGSWASKYDRADKLLISYQVANGSWSSPDRGKTWLSPGGVVTQVAENLLYRRATAILFPTRSPSNPADFRVPTSSADFEPDVLVRLGR